MIEDLRYCTQIRRIVGETEFHAGVFHADHCSGCREIPLWMRDIVWDHLKAEVARNTYHLELLARDSKCGARTHFDQGVPTVCHLKPHGSEVEHEGISRDEIVRW